jgi:excisionase family DNA binding protein
MVKYNISAEDLQKLKIVNQKSILSFKEALVYLDVSESFLYKLTSKKSIGFAKPNGGKIYFKKEDLDMWMLQNMSTSESVKEDEIMNHLKKNYNGEKIDR